MKEDLNHLCDISSVIRVEAADPPLDGAVPPPRGRRRRRVPASDHVLVQLGLRLELGAAPSALVRPRVRAAAILATSLLVAHLRPKGGPQVA